MLHLGTDEKHFNGSVVTEYCICLCRLEQQHIVSQPEGWSEYQKDPGNVLKVIFFPPSSAHTEVLVAAETSSKQEHHDCEP